MHGKLVLLITAFLICTAAISSTAGAAGPVGVSGTWSTTPILPTGFKQAGTNIKLPGIVNSIWTGDLSGTTIATTTFLIHADGSAVAAPAVETLTGTVAGVGSGTLTFEEQAHSQPDGSTTIGATVVRGTGDLAGLHGRVIFVGVCDVSGACTGTYSGQLHE